MKLEVFINLLQLVGGIILSIGYIPQITKTIKTKSVEDISSTYYLNVFIGIMFMEIYAIYNAVQGVAYMFLITNSVSSLLSGSMLFLTKRYGKKKNKKKVII